MEKRQQSNFFYRFYQFLLHVDGDFLENCQPSSFANSDNKDKTVDLKETSMDKYTVISVVCVVSFFAGLLFAFVKAGGIGAALYLILVFGVLSGLYEAWELGLF